MLWQSKAEFGSADEVQQTVTVPCPVLHAACDMHIAVHVLALHNTQAMIPCAGKAWCPAGCSLTATAALDSLIARKQECQH